MDTIVVTVTIPSGWLEGLNLNEDDLLVLLAHGRPGALVLEDQNGDGVELRATELAKMLAARPGCSVVLASCDGAALDDEGGSTATTLLAGGALAVAAMNGPISQDAADAFLEGLLGGLARGEPIEVAAASGRQQIIAALGERGGDWTLPVCWQRALDRPLVLPPDEAIRRGARRLTERAPSWAGQLAAGGWLGLLAAFSLQSLLLPGTVAVPGIVKVLAEHIIYRTPEQGRSGTAEALKAVETAELGTSAVSVVQRLSGSTVTFERGRSGTS